MTSVKEAKARQAAAMETPSGLAKSCRKLGIAFWDYLGARLDVQACANVPYLPDLVRCRGHPA